MYSYASDHVKYLELCVLAHVVVYVLPHMRIPAHTCMGRPIRVWDIRYAYGTILCPIHVWASHMSIRVWDFPYAYGPVYAYGAEHIYIPAIL